MSNQSFKIGTAVFVSGFGLNTSREQVTLNRIAIIREYREVKFGSVAIVEIDGKLYSVPPRQMYMYPHEIGTFVFVSGYTHNNLGDQVTLNRIAKIVNYEARKSGLVAVVEIEDQLYSVMLHQMFVYPHEIGTSVFVSGFGHNSLGNQVNLNRIAIIVNYEARGRNLVAIVEIDGQLCSVVLHHMFMYPYEIDTTVYIDGYGFKISEDQERVLLNKIAIIENYESRGKNLIAIVKIDGQLYSVMLTQITHVPGESGTAVLINGFGINRSSGLREKVNFDNRMAIIIRYFKKGNDLIVYIDVNDGNVYSTHPSTLIVFQRMPFQEDFTKHLEVCKSKTFTEWLESLEEIIPPELLEFRKNRLSMFEKAQLQWETESRLGSGLSLDYDYKKKFSEFLTTQFNSKDRVLCVDYENIQSLFKESTSHETKRYIVSEALKKGCNKVLLIAKSQESHKWIISDFSTDMGDLECKTLFLQTSGMYFIRHSEDNIETAKEQWTEWAEKTDPETVKAYTTMWGDNFPPFLDDTWQQLVHRVDDKQLKILRGEDDAMLVVALCFLRSIVDNVCLMTYDSKLVLDFVKYSHFLPAFKCEMGYFNQGVHNNFNKFGVKFFENPHCMSQKDVSDLFHELLFGRESSVEAGSQRSASAMPSFGLASDMPLSVDAGFDFASAMPSFVEAGSQRFASDMPRFGLASDMPSSVDAGSQRFASAIPSFVEAGSQSSASDMPRFGFASAMPSSVEAGSQRSASTMPSFVEAGSVTHKKLKDKKNQDKSFLKYLKYKQKYLLLKQKLGFL